MRPLRMAMGNAALLTLMLGHFTNDIFAGVLPMLYPIMKNRFDLSNAEVGLATLAYTGASSLSQPFFGYLSDHHSRRWYASATLIWGSAFVSLYGFASNFPMFLTLAFLAGIGSGAYHPLGASNAAAITADRYKNAAMSLYTVGGTSGYALGPLIAVALLALFGPHGTLALLAPGLVVAMLLLSQMKRVERVRRSSDLARRDDPSDGAPPLLMLARLIGVVMLRSWVFLAVVQFVPLWYDDLGHSAAFYGGMVTTIILAGAVGTLVGGSTADRIGQRRVVVVSLLAAVPALFLFVAFPGRIALLTGALFGLCCDASLSATLVAAQRMLPRRSGVASGVVLGLGFITGGIGVPTTGWLADRVGVQSALMIVATLLVAAAGLAFTVDWADPSVTASTFDLLDDTGSVRAAPSAGQ